MATYPREVAKGQTQRNGRYIYQCNACKGKGRIGKETCSWCYNLDVARILEEMSIGARGQRYYALLKAFLSVNGQAIVHWAKTMRAADDKFTIIEVAAISLKFGLNFKATCEWLEETGCIRTGSYARIHDARVKVKDIYEKARAKYPELSKGKA